ncbi:M15 family metallopeptidase [Legionella hackeliae]|uniref:D-alanyl-D-alanine dipeptidase n=1 Tax=Legionella hackeliae TaxID=449 RepID=A0A0A8ULG0_LEGHA|nr:M15 family metallopeptidase [Legionella hackeliae]KTD14816.1 D-alanyl-D-alanine dipeptidase [Legionella hackeliae]CEK09558.1 putative D-alanyl-D-alanine dipeptidase [Legionella hackeliae]STX49468.1 D-alanyl-D-alanine dipeptidase [Legionella hackeliae]
MHKQFLPSDYEVVEFTNQIHPRIKICPIYYAQGLSPYSTILGRRAVLEGLLKAVEVLPKTCGLLIWDVYRPREVQRKLFSWMSEEIRKKYAGLSEEEYQTEILKYVSPPASIGDSYCSPHLSGGAVDLTLYDVESIEILDMGTPFDECSEKAHRDYFALKSVLSSEEVAIQQRREWLRTAMEASGFTSYHYEWWHFDMGNIFWANVTGQEAVFGPLFGDAEWLSL